MWYFLRSVLWHCWLGNRNGVQRVKSWMSLCWWWRFDYNFENLTAAVVTTIPSSLAPTLSIMETFRFCDRRPHPQTVVWVRCVDGVKKSIRPANVARAIFTGTYLRTLGKTKPNLEWLPEKNRPVKNYCISSIWQMTKMMMMTMMVIDEAMRLYFMRMACPAKHRIRNCPSSSGSNVHATST